MAGPLFFASQCLPAIDQLSPSKERRPLWSQQTTSQQVSPCMLQMFMEKYNPEATNFTKNPEKYIRWSVAEVQRLIAEDLFEARVSHHYQSLLLLLTELVNTKHRPYQQEPWLTNRIPCKLSLTNGGPVGVFCTTDIIIIIVTRFSCLEAGCVCRQAAAEAAKILPLVGLARSKQDPINRGHGAQYLTGPRQPGPFT